MHKSRRPESTASYDRYRCSVVTVGTNGTHEVRNILILVQKISENSTNLVADQLRMTDVHFNALAEAKDGANPSSLDRCTS